MNNRLFWKLTLIIVAGTVAIFYVINVLTSRTEFGMSFIAPEFREEILSWGKEAEKLYLSGDTHALRDWLNQLQEQEQTWAAVVKSNITDVTSEQLPKRFKEEFRLGRHLEWKIHLYFDNPIMEVRFTDRDYHFLILLPQRMRPGYYWDYVHIGLQFILPLILFTVLSIVLYRHIMAPLRKLEHATRAFSLGNFDSRARKLLGHRNDELTQLADTFDQMAARIGELIISQRQLIADLSHELRTPLTRLDIAISSLENTQNKNLDIERIQRESRHIRRLVEDTLTLAWLNNEKPLLEHEDVDLVDLIEVIVEDAQFEFPDRELIADLPNEWELRNTNHRALGQSIENVLRNALRHTPSTKTVSLALKHDSKFCHIIIKDQGPGVAEPDLKKMFEPFVRLDRSRSNSPDGFGLGLALAKRQLQAINASIEAKNQNKGGLKVTISIPLSI